MTHETSPQTHVVTKPPTSGELRELALRSFNDGTIQHVYLKPHDTLHDPKTAPTIPYFILSKTTHSEDAAEAEVFTGVVVDEGALFLDGLAKSTGITIQFNLHEDSSEPATAELTSNRQ